MIAENEGDYALASSTKEFAEILAEVASLFGEPEAQRIEEEVLEEEHARLEEEQRVLKKLLAEAEPEEAKGKTCSGKRAKGKASQRKGYG